MTLERINYLFENRLITAEEHNDLVRLTVSDKYKRNSMYSYLTIIFAITGYLLMLTIKQGNSVTGLLSSGEQRAWAGAILSTLSVAVFRKARREDGARNNRNNYAYIGIGIAIAILIIVVPAIIMSI